MLATPEMLPWEILGLHIPLDSLIVEADRENIRRFKEPNPQVLGPFLGPIS